MSKGFTLVELMIVILIIGILAALAIPKLLSATTRAKLSEFKPQLKCIYTLQETHLTEAGSYTMDKSLAGFKDPIGGNFTYDLLSPDVISDMRGKIVGTATTAAGQSIKLSNETFLGGSVAELVACVDGNSTQFAVKPQVAKDASMDYVKQISICK